ncbi:hypothetical protein ABZZ74_23545 [Streptomyces sp. NPDC006476]|uniref:hypothetical protein n=1 Tax=Streptomyces sp. NPDC006476 TaxID=3157175 RepID=UPI0033B70CE3
MNVDPNIPLGHSIPAHRAFGWCSHCPDRTPVEELAAWQTRELRRLVDETAQPTPCSEPNGCDPDGDLCDQHETERAHAEGEHAFCGPTCEVEFPSDKLRNFILAKGYPGTAGMLDELLRRAASGQLPAAAQQPKESAPAVPQCDGCGHLVHRARKCPALQYGERCECDEPLATDGEARS